MKTRRGMCGPCKDGNAALTQKNTVDTDRARIKAVNDVAALKVKYADALATIDRMEYERTAIGLLNENIDPLDIVPRHGSGTSEATAGWVASDWHVEELVNPRTISGLNEHNLDIGEKRAVKFFQSGLRLTDLMAKDVKIHTIVLALLGDFISGDIHEEVTEMSEVAPMYAIKVVQQRLISGIEFVLNHSGYHLVVPCHVGNHGRTTKTSRFANENGHSLEYLLYLHLASYFRNEPRVKFQIAEGMHSYLNVYDKTIRFQHGHAVKYGGGVGGIYVPVNKAISQWDQGRRADLDVFGHFHQQVDGGKFLCNGSLIGYNAFALSIKAGFEPPRQTLFLMDKKRGRTCNWPIIVSG